MVDAAAQAIAKLPSLWLRSNRGMHEVCRYGSGDEPEIVVVRKFNTSAAAETWAHDETRRLQAHAALEAALTVEAEDDVRK